MEIAKASMEVKSVKFRGWSFQLFVEATSKTFAKSLRGSFRGSVEASVEVRESFRKLRLKLPGFVSLLKLPYLSWKLSRKLPLKHSWKLRRLQWKPWKLPRKLSRTSTQKTSSSGGRIFFLVFALFWLLSVKQQYNRLRVVLSALQQLSPSCSLLATGTCSSSSCMCVY